MAIFRQVNIDQAPFWWKQHEVMLPVENHLSLWNSNLDWPYLSNYVERVKAVI